MTRMREDIGREAQYDGLEIDEDLERERHGWLAERISWVCMLLVTVAALLGVFGRGPISHRTVVADQGRLRIRYERFARVRTPMTVQVWIGPSPGDGPVSGGTADTVRMRAPAGGEEVGGHVAIWIDRRYVEQGEVVRVVPTPVEVDAVREWIVYRFRRTQVHEPMSVSFDLEPERFGYVVGRLGVDAGSSRPLVTPVRAVEFRQLLYP